MRVAVAVVVLLAGCTDSSRTYQAYVPFTPLLFEYRTTAGDWQTPAGAGSDDGTWTYALDVDDDYEVVAVCADQAHGVGSIGFATFETFQLRDEAPLVVDDSCTAISTAPTATVFGQMQQPGNVVTPDAVGGGSATTTPWSYALAARSGVNDVVALSADTGAYRIAIRHDQMIAADLVEPTFDLSNEGDQIRPWTPAVMGALPTDGILEETVLLTKNGVQIVLGFGGFIVPPSQLVDGDMHELVIFDESDETFYFTDHFAHTPRTTYELPPRIGPLTFGATSVTWQSLPDGFEWAQLDIADATNDDLAFATTGWLAARGASSLAFDGAIPDYDPAWAASSLSRSLELYGMVHDEGPNYFEFSTQVYDPNGMH